MKRKANKYKINQSSREESGHAPDAEESLDQASMESEATMIERSPQAREALQRFFDRLTLTDTDRKLLFVKRGLTNETIDALGFRSNPESNKDLLLEMTRHFAPEVLVECGLWKIDPDKAGEAAKPNPQFYGMSIVEKRDEKGRKIRDETGEVVRECTWNNPIIIPYFNEAGQLIHLRPHKGMMAGKSPRLYVPRTKGRPLALHSNGHPQFAIITEGEFKAAALWQVLGEVAQIAALPGITMAKPLIGDVEDSCEAKYLQCRVPGNVV